MVLSYFLWKRGENKWFNYKFCLCFINPCIYNVVPEKSIIYIERETNE